MTKIIQVIYAILKIATRKEYQLCLIYLLYFFRSPRHPLFYSYSLACLDGTDKANPNAAFLVYRILHKHIQTHKFNMLR